MKKPTTATHLTRKDIAEELKISTKQAGRLMEKMPTISIGATHKRVARADFDQWLEQQKRMSIAKGDEGGAIYQSHRSDSDVPLNQSEDSVKARAERMRMERDKRSRAALS